MARLPEIGNDVAITPQVRSRVSGAEVAAASPMGTLADVAGFAGQRISAKAEEYEQGVAVAQTAKTLNDARTNALKLMGEANGNVEAFQKSWEGYSNGLLSTVPEAYRSKVEAEFTTIGGNTARSIIDQQQNRDRQMATDRINARQATLLADMTDMAQNGLTSSEAYRNAHDEYVSLTQEKVSNPFFAYSQARADLDLSNAEDALVGASVSGELERIYQKDGFTAAQKRAQEIYDDAGNGLAKVKKLKAIQAGLKSVHALYATDTAARRQFSADRQEIVAALADGSLPADHPIVDDMMATATSLRDPVSRLSLETARAKARLNPMGSMDLAGRLQYLRSLGGPQARGVRNNNPLNIEAGGFTEGQAGFVGSDGRFAKFATPEAGIAAADNLLQSYGRQGIGTVAGVIGKWAPASDGNDTAAYAAKVASALGVKPTDAIDLSDPAIRQKMIGAMAEVESGVKASSPMDGYVKGVLPEVRKQIGAALDDAIAHAKDGLDHDQPLDAGQMKDLTDAARIVDDAGKYDAVQELFARSAAVSALVGAPVPDQTALVDSLRGAGPAGDEFLRTAALDQAVATHNRMDQLLTTNPRALGMQLGLIKPDAAVDANTASPDLMRARQSDIEKVEAAEQTAALQVLSPAEADGLGQAIGGGNGQNAYASLLALDTPHLMATLAMPGLKDGLAASARTTDPTKLNQAMTFMDAVWGRAPAQAQAIFGSDAIDTLQDWQATLRYSSPEELAKTLQQRADPQFRERQKRLVQEGETIARKTSFDSLLGEFNPWGPGNAAGAPIDTLTRDTFMSDYEALYAQRYASTLDESTAHKQTIERMKAIWGRSDVNGGKLTLYPPETTYQPVEGSHDWMRGQIEKDLEAQLGFKPANYAVVADRVTEGDIAAGRPASYLVAVVDPTSGQPIMVHDPSQADGLLRYRWDQNAAVTAARADFLAKRQGVGLGFLDQIKRNLSQPPPLPWESFNRPSDTPAGP